MRAIDLAIAMIAGSVVAATVAATPFFLKSPPEVKPPIVKSDSLPSVREVPIYRDVQHDEIPPSKPDPPEPIKPPEPIQPQTHERPIYNDICARTGGWRVTIGRSWRCKYRRSR